MEFREFNLLLPTFFHVSVYSSSVISLLSSHWSLRLLRVNKKVFSASCLNLIKYVFLVKKGEKIFIISIYIQEYYGPSKGHDITIAIR